MEIELFALISSCSLKREKEIPGSSCRGYAEKRTRHTKGFLPRVTERRKRNKKKLGYTVDKRTTKSMDGLLTFNRQTEARATTVVSAAEYISWRAFGRLMQ